MNLALQVDDLRVGTPGGRVLLSCDHFDATPGATIGLRGPSGAGKSTFLYALAGLHPAMTGHIRWGATDLVQLNDAARAAFRRSHVGLIFQEFLLFEELSALGNASLATAFNPAEKRRSITDTARDFLKSLKVPAEARTVDSFPAASDNALRLPALWPTIPRSFSRTNRRQASTARPPMP